MPKKRGSQTPPPAAPSADHSPTDAALLSAALNGGDAALRALMDRYDRLVRYTIFRAAKRQCLRDPEWLDGVASETWTGLLQSLRREGAKRPQSLAAYVATVARFRTVAALRRSGAASAPLPAAGGRSADPDSYPERHLSPAPEPDPAALLSDLDSLEQLRGSVAALSESDKTLLSQLESITQRRWVDAGRALGMSESTLRSRWKSLLDRLRAVFEQKA